MVKMCHAERRRRAPAPEERVRLEPRVFAPLRTARSPCRGTRCDTASAQHFMIETASLRATMDRDTNSKHLSSTAK
jgi:hypothetical protein